MKKFLSTIILFVIVLSVNAFTILTQTSLVNKINTSTLITGELYQISDRSSITLVALSPSHISNQGSGIFYHPNYDLYSIWNSSTTYSIGDYSIYDGKIWKNVTGTNFNVVPNIDTINWTYQYESDSTGYKSEVCQVIYYTLQDVLVYKQDTKLNTVTASINTQDEFGVNPINIFQWGNDNVSENIVVNSLLNCVNQEQTITYNVLSGLSLIDADSNKGLINNNYLESEGKMYVRNNAGYVFFNKGYTNSIFDINHQDGEIAFNTLYTSDSYLSAYKNSGKIDAHNIFTGKLYANENCDTCRITGFVMWHGTRAYLNKNKGLFGAILFEVGSELYAENNEGVIKWATLTNTCFVNILNNKNTVSRLFIRGNGTINLTLNQGKEIYFLDAVLEKGETLTLDPTKDYFYQWNKPFINVWK